MSKTTTQKTYADPEVPLARLQFIIDMVFAIAMMTFLFIFPWLEVNRTAANPLLDLLANEVDNFISIGLIYLVVAMYWYKHTMHFKYLQRIDVGQVILQFTYMFGVVMLPFSVWLTLALEEYKLSYVIHNLNLIWLGVFSIMAWNQATKNNRLVDQELPAEVVKATRRAALLEPTVMGIGIIGALIGPLWWMLSFLLLIIVPLLESTLKKKKE